MNIGNQNALLKIVMDIILIFKYFADERFDQLIEKKMSKNENYNKLQPAKVTYI